MPSPWFLVPAALAASTSGYATTYLTVEQAQAVLFPGIALTAAPVTLTPAQRSAIEKKSDVRVRSADVRAWRASTGAWFLVDEVLGKHEFITYAVSLDAGGAVLGVEIMDYRETYGYQVRDAQWRKQFTGKTAASPLKLDADIRNISGATLSSRHVTDGVKRLLATYAIALAPSR